MNSRTIRRLKHVRKAVRVLIRLASRLVESNPPAQPGPKPQNPLPTYPAQLIIYGPEESTVVEGTTITYPDGSIGLELPLTAPPVEGTTVQLILYIPEESGIIEGVTGFPHSDGSFDIFPID